MKILLINVLDPRDLHTDPHLGLGYLAAYVRNQAEIRIIDSNIESNLEEFQPDIVGISSVSQNYDIAKKTAKKCKKHKAVVVIGGVHITLMPHTLDKNMDMGVIGEGEVTFLEIVKMIKKYGLNKTRLKKINGIIYWDRNKIKHTKPRNFIKNLDSIPYPARDLLNFNKKMPTIFSSRGCPYKCVFCSSTRFWNTVRFNSAEHVVNEIKYLIDEYDAKHITFSDDLFIADKTRLEKIVEMIEKEGINKKVDFTVSCRANLVDHATAKLLKRMNTELVTMGLESGSEEILRYAKGDVTVNDNEKAINFLKYYDINVQATFIIGFPMDTEGTIIETLNFIKKSKLDSFEVYLLSPLPATPIWDYALKKGIVSEKMKWSKISHRSEYDINEKLVLTENLTPEELFSLHKKFIWLRKKRKFKHMLKNAVRHPYRVLPFIRRTIS